MMITDFYSALWLCLSHKVHVIVILHNVMFTGQTNYLVIICIPGKYNTIPGLYVYIYIWMLANVSVAMI